MPEYVVIRDITQRYDHRLGPAVVGFYACLSADIPETTSMATTVSTWRRDVLGFLHTA